MGVLREDHKVGVTVLRGRLQERVRDLGKAPCKVQNPEGGSQRERLMREESQERLRAPRIPKGQIL